MSAPGTGGQNPDSLETIMAGNADGATGCCITVDSTADGLAVLSVTGQLKAASGEPLNVHELSFTELRQHFPQLIAIGQAIELAKSCSAKVGITLRSASVFSAVKIPITMAGMHENCYFAGLSLMEAARLATAHAGIHFVADLPKTDGDLSAVIRAARETGLFGLRVHPSSVTRTFLDDCHRSGLFVATLETNDIDELERLLGLGVNFIETSRPDLAFALSPSASSTADDEFQLRF